MQIFSGIVQEGEHTAASLGFPTINIPLKETIEGGIYAANVKVEQNQKQQQYDAAAYVNTSRATLEAHLLDFAGDLYGKDVTIELLKKIRDDRQFDQEDELKVAIAEDIVAVRQYFDL